MVSSSSMNVWEENVIAMVVYIAVFNWVPLFLEWQTRMNIVLKRIRNPETGVFSNASYISVLKWRYLFWHKVEKNYFPSVCMDHIWYVLLVLANPTTCRLTQHFWRLSFHHFQLLFPNNCPQLNFTSLESKDCKPPHWSVACACLCMPVCVSVHVSRVSAQFN